MSIGRREFFASVGSGPVAGGHGLWAKKEVFGG